MDPRTNLLPLAALFALAAPGSTGAADEAAPRNSPDPVYFEDVVLPMLDTTCGTSGCHGGPGAGRLILERPDFLGARSREVFERNLATVLQFVEFGRPLESRLVQKPLARRDGGLPHSGGTYDFRKGSEQYRILDEWIRGVELQDVPPLADAGDDRRAKLDEVVRLDGARSRERRGRPLTWRWSIASRPEGSTPRLDGKDTATPAFAADRVGAYQLTLVVSNGEQESAPDTVLVEVDDLPFALVPGESAEELVGFRVTEDAGANGGRALVVSRQTEDTEALARFPVLLPEPGPYRLFARVDAREGLETPLRFSFDGGPEMRLAPAPTGGYRFLPVTGEEAKAALPAAGGELREGSALVRGGRLELAGVPSRPARLVYGDGAGDGSLRARITFGEPRAGALHAARMAVVFDWRDAGHHRFAGYELGRSRAVVGQVRGGVEEILAERRVPLRPGLELRLDVELKGDRAFVLFGAATPLEATLDGPVGHGEVGLMATAPVTVDDLTLDVTGIAPAELDFAVEGFPDGWLARGAHVLLVRADGDDAPRLDEVLIARADFGAGVDDAARREIRALYLDLLGRTPTPVELLTAAGMDRDGLVRRLVGSLEFYEAWYENELYHYLLLDNFRPRTPEMDALPARLANGQTTVPDAIRQIVISQAFNARNPGNDTFVSVVLEQLLGVVVQDDVRTLEAGKRMYDGHEVTLFDRRGRSQSDLVSIVLAHEDFLPRLLARLHARAFPVAPSRAALADWSARLRDDARAFESIVVEWFTSDAYGAALATPRRKTDAMWIRSLFVDLLERAPTFQEFRNFRNALQALADSTPLRSVLAKVILDSGRVAVPPEEGLDVDGFVAEQFRRFLGRAPTPDEQAVFRRELEGPDCDPSTVIHALVSSTEYQHY